MAEEEQDRPLAAVLDHPSSNNEDNLQKHGHTKLMKRCACPLVFLLLLAIVIIVLIFAVFRVKDPEIKMNGIKVTRLDFVNSTTPNRQRINISLIADVSVKNPNVVSFRYSNTTTTLYYHGIIVGEARGPPGRAEARRTERMNVTVDVIAERIMNSSYFRTELGSGLLTMSSFLRVPGRVKIINLFKKHVVVIMNCTTTFNISSQAIQDLNCKRKVKF